MSPTLAPLLCLRLSLAVRVSCLRPSSVMNILSISLPQ